MAPILLELEELHKHLLHNDFLGFFIDKKNKMLTEINTAERATLCNFFDLIFAQLIINIVFILPTLFTQKVKNYFFLIVGLIFF